MSWDAVRAWRDRLRTLDPAPLAPGLSPAGARAAWGAALDALADDVLDRVAAIEGEPFPAAAFVAARTVFTAPLEWCAVLLGRGTEVTLKHPVGHPGAATVYADLARAVDLPLRVTDDRAAIDDVPLVVAMGSDATVAAIREQAEDARVLGFGHRFSVAWITGLDALPALAEDVALYDGRGCFSPVAVLTPLAAGDVLDRLGGALAEVQERWPRGQVSDEEHARIRTRRALAAVVGEVRRGDGWELHALPPSRLDPVALPRAVAVHQTTDPAAALARWSRWLSTVGTDQVGLSWPGARTCRPGRMQRPPVERLHDGIDWLRATLRTSR